MLAPKLSAPPESGTVNTLWLLSPQLLAQAPLAANLNWTLVALLKVASYCQVLLALSCMLFVAAFQLLKVAATLIEPYGLPVFQSTWMACAAAVSATLMASLPSVVISQHGAGELRLAAWATGEPLSLTAWTLSGLYT